MSTTAAGTTRAFAPRKRDIEPASRLEIAAIELLAGRALESELLQELDLSDLVGALIVLRGRQLA